jgi:hypothetical protein
VKEEKMSEETGKKHSLDIVVRMQKATPRIVEPKNR